MLTVESTIQDVHEAKYMKMKIATETRRLRKMLMKFRKAITPSLPKPLVENVHGLAYNSAIESICNYPPHGGKGVKLGP